MDEIEELKQDLGPAAIEFNNSQLRQLSNELDLMAEFLLDLYVIRHSGNRKSGGEQVFDRTGP
jgi:hypothetical protein